MTLDDESNEWNEADWWEWIDLNDLDEYPLYETLKVPKNASRSRLQAAFHRYSRTQERDRFSRVCLAYLVLKDDEKRRIYDECGWKHLRQSESYQAFSVFDADPNQVFEDFFAGKEEEDRDYLLMNSNAAFSDDDDDNPNKIPIDDDEIHVSLEELAKARESRSAKVTAAEDQEIDRMFRSFMMNGQVKSSFGSFEARSEPWIGEVVKLDYGKEPCGESLRGKRKRSIPPLSRRRRKLRLVKRCAKRTRNGLLQTG